MLNCLFNIFNFGNLGFVVNLGIVLLLTGLIMIYVRNKFATYDKYLEEQSNMLRNLVTTLQSQQYKGGNDQLASNVAINAARKINLNNSNSNTNNKIVVSDDENDSDDTDDTDDSDETDDSEEETYESDDSEESDDTNDSQSNYSNSDSNKNNLNINEESKEYQLEVDPEVNNSERNEKKLLTKYLDSKNYNDNIETIETKKNLLEMGGLGMIELNNINLVGGIGGVQTMGMGGVCYLELLSELNDSNCENDMSQCIKVISINSTNPNNQNDNNEGKIFELNDNEDVSNVLDESFIVSKLTNSASVSVINLDETTDLNDSSNKYNLEQLKDMKKTQLQDLCKKRNISTNGTRNELITRLSNVV